MRIYENKSIDVCDHAPRLTGHILGVSVDRYSSPFCRILPSARTRGVSSLTPIFSCTVRNEVAW